jgi:alcohol dehydrogenase
VLIVGAGPVGLAAMITCQLYSPSMIIMVDIDQNLLKVTKSLEAHHTIDPSDRKYRESCEISDRWEATDTVTDAAGSHKRLNSVGIWLLQVASLPTLDFIGRRPA